MPALGGRAFLAGGKDRGRTKQIREPLGCPEQNASIDDTIFFVDFQDNFMEKFSIISVSQFWAAGYGLVGGIGPLSHLR